MSQYRRRAPGIDANAFILGGISLGEQRRMAREAQLRAAQSRRKDPDAAREAQRQANEAARQKAAQQAEEKRKKDEERAELRERRRQDKERRARIAESAAIDRQRRRTTLNDLLIRADEAAQGGIGFGGAITRDTVDFVLRENPELDPEVAGAFRDAFGRAGVDESELIGAEAGAFARLRRDRFRQALDL